MLKSAFLLRHPRIFIWDGMQQAMVQAQSTLASAQLLVSPRFTDGLTAQLDSDTTRRRVALGCQLADYLERNPSALIRGRYVSERDR
jgi:hypothetical protein